jgi:hypothetical protein
MSARWTKVSKSGINKIDLIVAGLRRGKKIKGKRGAR